MTSSDLFSLLPHNLYANSSPSSPGASPLLPHQLYSAPSSLSVPSSSTRNTGRFLDLAAVLDTIPEFKGAFASHLLTRLRSMLSSEEPSAAREVTNSADLLICLVDSGADPFLEGTVAKAREALVEWEEASTKMARAQELMLQALDDVSEFI